MVFNNFVEIGRVVYVVRGKEGGKVAAVVNIVDANRVLIDGPCSNVTRTCINLKDAQLTKFRLPGLRPGARSGTVKKAWEAEGVSKSWDASTWNQKLVRRSLKANMSDFDRFKLMKAKQMRNQIVRGEMAKLKKAGGAKKPAAKKAPKKK